MKAAIKLFIIACVITLCACIRVNTFYVPNVSFDPSKETIRVVTYNIKIGLNDLNKVEHNLRHINADVVFLQEVHGPAIPGNQFGQVNQAKKLADALDMNYVFGKAQQWQSGEYGLAILSKYNITKSLVVELPNRPGEEQEILLIATIETLDKEVHLATTHLIANTKNKDNDADALRWEQANAIIDYLEVLELSSLIHSDTPTPVILGGDFNAYGCSPIKDLYREKYVDVFKTKGKGWGATFPSYFPIVKLDYIFLDGDDLKPIKSKVYKEGGSDHFPLWADIKIN